MIEINEWVPDAAHDDTPRADLPPSLPWVYAAHPRRWRVDIEGKRLLPDLIQISRMRGTSGQLTSRSYSAMRSQYEEEGWVILPPEIYAETGKGGSYIQEVAVVGGVAYLPRWVETTPGSSLIEVDSEGYDDFCAWLAETGKVPQPQRAYLRGLLAHARDMHATYSRTAHNDPNAKARAAEWAAAVEILTEAIARPAKSKTTSKTASKPAGE